MMTDVTPARFANWGLADLDPQITRDNIGADGGAAMVEGCAEAPSIGMHSGHSVSECLVT